MADSEQRSDSTTLSSLASDLERQLHGRLEHGRFASRNPGTELVDRRYRHCAPPRWALVCEALLASGIRVA
jgi:hypothetical protein